MTAFDSFRCGTAAFALCCAIPAFAQEKLPTIEVGGAKAHITQRRSVAARPVSRQIAARPATRPLASPRSAPLAPTSAPLQPPSLRDAPVTSSSTRDFTGAEVVSRSYAQPAESLEAAPGLIVAQHSGAGKANQYFLRGFALDHGYDIGLTVDGLPINEGSHVHSNGYNDANFLIPELFREVEVRKGPYFADEGVFSSVGSIHIGLIDQMRDGYVSATGGSFGYGRLLGIKSYALGAGEILGALELNNYNGPWERPDEQRKINGVLRYAQGTEENGFAVTALAYSNHWYATDQIPQRAVDQGLLSRWGTEDPTDGGNATRYALMGRWSETNKYDFSRIEIYASRVTTNLYDDFTYNLVNPLPLNDQTYQFDRRSVFGFNAFHGWNYTIGNFPTVTRIGAQTRYDQIRNGFGDAFERQRYDEVRNDSIKNYTHGVWTDTTIRWTPWFRTTAGLRIDYAHGSVQSVLNSALAPGWFNGTPFLIGNVNAGELGRVFTSPKAGAVLGPFPELANSEFFANFGEGLREEDIRGSLAHFDPATGDYIPNVQLLTKTRGAEIGVRSKPVANLDTTLTLFWQDFDAENTFAGDEGVTVYGRPGRRLGFEWTGRYAATPWLRFLGEVTGTHARFRGNDNVQQATYLNALAGGVVDPDSGAFADPLFPLTLRGVSPGNYLTLAPVWVAKGGVELGEAKGWFGLLQYRYFGARPLTEDGQLKSPALGTLNARLGYRFDNGVSFQLDGFNITNSRSDEITYGYGSFARSDYLMFPAYAGGSIGIGDRHFKPVTPPAVRFTLSGPLTALQNASLPGF